MGKSARTLHKTKILENGKGTVFTNIQSAFKEFRSNEKNYGKARTYVTAIIPEEFEGYDDLENFGLPGWTAMTLKPDKYGNIADWKDKFRSGGARKLRNAIYIVGVKSKVQTAEGKVGYRILDYNAPTPEQAMAMLSYWPRAGIPMDNLKKTESYYLESSRNNLYYGKTIIDQATGDPVQVQMTTRQVFRIPKLTTNEFRVKAWLRTHPKVVQETSAQRLYDEFWDVGRPQLRRIRNEFRAELAGKETYGGKKLKK